MEIKPLNQETCPLLGQNEISGQAYIQRQSQECNSKRIAELNYLGAGRKESGQFCSFAFLHLVSVDFCTCNQMTAKIVFYQDVS